MMKILKNSSKFFVAIIITFSFIISASAARELVPLGKAAGIKISSKGAVVVGFSEDMAENPAKTSGIKVGDIITKAGNVAIFSNSDLVKAVSESRGNPVTIEYIRNEKTNTLSVTPKANDDGNFAIGVFVCDSIAGIGTLTYLDPLNGTYGALGHGISDSKTNVIVPLLDGELLPSTVQSVKHGRPGEPGELVGSFDASKKIATIEKNNEAGIFGKVTDKNIINTKAPLPTAEKNEIHRGKATILSNIEGNEVKEYDIEITAIYFAGEKTKNMLIRATDPELLEKTGGIVCGMSGSPIIQNGKLIGAVTHVLVNDPTRGYGIFIENMLAEAEKMK